MTVPFTLRDPLPGAAQGKMVEAGVARSPPMFATKARTSKKSGDFLHHKWYLLRALMTKD